MKTTDPYLGLKPKNPSQYHLGGAVPRFLLWRNCSAQTCIFPQTSLTRSGGVLRSMLYTTILLGLNILNVHRYLGSHYELLREDACSTLRDIALTMKFTPNMSDQAALCIYENVTIKHP